MRKPANIAASVRARLLNLSRERNQPFQLLLTRYVLERLLYRLSLVELIEAMGISVRDLLRRKDTPYAELGLDDPKWDDDQLINLMLRQPILINRPIVVTPKGVRLCRPSERVLEILPNPDIGAFVKEDGEVVRRTHKVS